MTRCLCPYCRQEIRYIVAAPSLGNNGNIPVDLVEWELITEKGRLVRGFKRHKCPPKPEQCTIPGITTDTCHAFNSGEYMNGFVCPVKKE
jgi:hypothetical protein